MLLRIIKEFASNNPENHNIPALPKPARKPTVLSPFKTTLLLCQRNRALVKLDGHMRVNMRLI